MAATHYSLAEAMVDPETLLSRPESRLTQEERDFLGLTAFAEATNEAQRMQAMQRLVVKMTAHGLSAFDVQHELGCAGFEINLLRIKAILDNPLVQAQVQKQRREAEQTTADEEGALAHAAPDCIRLLHEVVRSPYLVLDDPDGGPAKIQPILMSDRIFAAKQLLDRYKKTAPMSHRKGVIEHKGLAAPEIMDEMKEACRKALANEATGTDGE